MEEVTEKDKKDMEVFEKLNNISSSKYLFAFEKNKRIEMLGKIDDTFVYTLINGLLSDHPIVAKQIIKIILKEGK
jgi:hypothetical protein